MKDYEILLCIKRFKDSTGKKAFRASADYKDYQTDDGKSIKIPCSYYRVQKTTEESEEIIEIRAADLCNPFSFTSGDRPDDFFWVSRGIILDAIASKFKRH